MFPHILTRVIPQISSNISNESTKRGSARPEVTFIKQACRDAFFKTSMQRCIYADIFGHKRVARHRDPWREMFRVPLNIETHREKCLGCLSTSPGADILDDDEWCTSGVLQSEVHKVHVSFWPHHAHSCPSNFQHMFWEEWSIRTEWKQWIMAECNPNTFRQPPQMCRLHLISDCFSCLLFECNDNITCDVGLCLSVFDNFMCDGVMLVSICLSLKISCVMLVSVCLSFIISCVMLVCVCLSYQ